jgi:Xaa-Pro aminopeptidase
MKQRLEQLYRLLDEGGYDGLIATGRSNQLTFIDHPDPTTVFGWPGGGGVPYLLVTPDRQVVFPSTVQSNACRDKLTGCEVIPNDLGDSSPDAQLAAYLGKSGLRRLATDGLREEALGQIGAAAPALTLTDEAERLCDMRRRRTPEEITMLRKTAAIGDAGIDAAFAALRVGGTPREAEAAGVAVMLRAGCEAAMINVVTGPSTQYLDSGTDFRRTIQEGDMVFMDISIWYRGYLGDQTRAAIVGEGTPAQRDLLEAVKQSFYEVRAALVPGARAQEVYAIHCRNMEKRGWRKYFLHHISHGVGRGGADAGPAINAVSRDVLREDDVISCEPGVYVPGIGGARFEDIVHVTSAGPVPLTLSAIDRQVKG